MIILVRIIMMMYVGSHEELCICTDTSTHQLYL